MSSVFDPSKLNLDPNKPSEPKKTDVWMGIWSDTNWKTIPKKLNPTPANEPVATPSQAKPDVVDILDSVEIKTESVAETETLKIINESEATDNTIEEKQEPKITEENIISEPEAPKQKIIDINLKSLDDIIMLISDLKYDFATIEPAEDEVKVSFKKDKIEKDVKYIKFPTYNSILVQIKQATKLKVEITQSDQEGKWERKVKTQNFGLVAKTVPGSFWERIFIKAKKIVPKVDDKKAKKAPVGKMLWFLASALFVSLILWGAFITFIVLNANTIEDVKFFSSLGINLNDINLFITQIITIIFSILLFIETIVLAIFLFKFFLTKKEFKRKKILYGMIGFVVLLITFSTASAWMIIDQKVKSLPNWQELAFGDVQIFDNDKLISEDFDRQGSLIDDTTNLIGPVTIKYDLSLFQANEEKKWFQVKKYIWTFGKEVQEELTPILIKKFEEKGNYEISLIVEEVDPAGNTIEKAVENIPNISITHTVDIEESTVSNGWKVVKFDANNLKELWKLEWYFMDDLSTPVWEWYEFKPAKVFFEETVVGLYIRRDDKTEEVLDKVFVITTGSSSDISGEIIATESVKNNLEYELSVSDPDNSFGEWFIEEFEWKIGGKTIKKTADPTDLEASSSITYEFKNFWEQEISVVLRDAAGSLKEITKTLNIQRTLELRTRMKIYNEEELMEDIRYEKETNEYYIDDIGAPTSMKFDARLVRPKDLIYSLTEVTWDVGWDGNIDGTGKVFEDSVDVEWNKTIVANYTFVHRRDKEDIVNLKEFIYIEAIKKDAILKLDIEKPTDYVPVTVRFDASKSYIKNDDIVKFIYDYGDGTTEERDAINPGRKYTRPGDYEVMLTVVGSSGQRYSMTKSLILKPQPQWVKVSTSLKRAPTLQWIDFSSEESEGQITGYFWSFWDGNNSTKANPTHSYSKPWKYTVTLKVDFVNSNTLEDEIEIEVYEQ